MDRLEELKNNPLFVDYQTILNYCPYYYEIGEYLKGIQLPEESDVLYFGVKYYRESGLYSTLAAEGKSRSSILDEIIDNVEFRYNQLIPLVKESIERSIKFCELIGYIANYPTTYPVPKEEEKNPELEKLMEEYDMIVRYHAGEPPRMLISSDDIVRLIETLDNNLRTIRGYIAKFEDRQIFMSKNSDDDVFMSDVSILGTCLEMPFSSEQRVGRSRRQEGFEYLKRQHGDLSQYQ